MTNLMLSADIVPALAKSARAGHPGSGTGMKRPRTPDHLPVLSDTFGCENALRHQKASSRNSSIRCLYARERDSGSDGGVSEITFRRIGTRASTLPDKACRRVA